ncbi:MAG: hypothetical protein IKC26_03295 [Clostridia bacterium]|nr:hypothetical protein [Clostridia bacterium]
MHDIICPACGSRFIARDVAFDMSQYITELLFDDPRDEDRILSAGFKYYADEESIVSNTTEDNEVPLFCERSVGPDSSDPWYPYVVTGRTVLDYIESRMNNLNADFDELLEDIREVYEDTQQHYNVQQRNFIRELYQRFFAAAENTTEFDIDDYNVQTAIQILLYLSDNEEKSLTLNIRLYSSGAGASNKGGYVIPDILFLLENGRSKRINKCCRNCGAQMPMEYGYYKMVPVVLLGSHFSGKTSLLLATLFTAKFRAPFSTINTNLSISTLDNDPDLVAFNNNIQRYADGLSTIKTDFSNIPILNLRVNDTIYTFVDWPGEKFISANEEKDADFIFNKRRIISEARHFICCLEPSQIDSSVGEADENVRFNAMDLVERFRWHMHFADLERLRSIVCVINKFDVLNGRSNTAPVFDMTAELSESDIYSDSTWKQEAFDRVNNTTKRYMEGRAAILYSSFEKMLDLESIPKYYFPVSPYGQNPEGADDNGFVTNNGHFAGMPLLSILKTDLIIQ